MAEGGPSLVANEQPPVLTERDSSPMPDERAPGPAAAPSSAAASALGRTPPLSAELKTLLWLQRRLLINAIRQGHRGTIGRVVGVGFLLLLSLPYIVLLGGGLIFALRTLPPRDGAALIAGGFTLILLMWAASPVTNQQIFESPNLPRLFVHPISFRGLVVGGLTTSIASFLTLLTLPFLAAVILGAARGPVSLGLIAIAAGLFFGVLVAVKTVMLDLFDLTAEDRRLRGGLSAVLVFLLIGFYLSQVGFASIGNSEARPFIDPMLRSTWLRWLPPGWFATGVEAVMTGRPAVWLAACAALAVLTAAGFALHLRLQGRLYFGDLIRLAPPSERAGAALADARRIPGFSAADSALLRALWRKDWLDLRRNPMVTRMAFLPLMFGVMSYFMSKNIPAPVWAIGLGAGAMSAFITSSFALNGLALLDHRGLGTLLRSPVPRRLVLLSHGLVYLVIATLFGTILGFSAALATRSPSVVAIAMLAAACTQLIGNGLAHIASIRFPYYVDLERGRQSPELGSVVATFLLLIGLPILSAPIYVMAALAWVLLPAGLPAVVFGSLLFAAVIYAVLLRVAAGQFAGREEQLIGDIVEARA